MVFQRSYRLPIPLLGVQLRGRHNPHLVLLSREELVHVNIDLDESEQPRLRVRGEPPLGWRGELALKSFLDEVCARLEQNLDVTIEYRAEAFHTAGVYAVLTYALVEAIVEEGGYEMSKSEVAQAANDIDESAGVALDYLDAARTSLAMNTSIVYRKGEDPIKLEVKGAKLILAGEEELGKVIEDDMPEELHIIVSRLAGMTVVEASRGLINSGWPWLVENWDVLARIENSIYYMLFGAQPPPDGCKWTPGLQTVFGVCISGDYGVEVELS